MPTDRSRSGVLPRCRLSRVRRKLRAAIFLGAAALYLLAPAGAAAETPTPEEELVFSTPTATPEDAFIPSRRTVAPSRTAATTSPTRPSRAPNGTLNMVRSFLPTVAPPTPQPSAYFMPRLITATTGLDNATGARLQGRVVDWRGNGMPAVVVQTTSAEGEASGITQADGSYVIDGLQAGIYLVALSGYESVAVGPLPVDGQSTFIVEFMESSRPTTPTPTSIPTAPATTTAVPPFRSPAASQSPPSTPTLASVAVTTPSSARPTPTPKSDAAFFSDDDIDYFTSTWVTPLLLGLAGGYIVFLVGVFGASLRR